MRKVSATSSNNSDSEEFVAYTQQVLEQAGLPARLEETELVHIWEERVAPFTHLFGPYWCESRRAHCEIVMDRSDDGMM
jgi:hypothetical protein